MDKQITLGKPHDGSGRRIGDSRPQTNSILHVQPGPTFIPVQPAPATTQPEPDRLSPLADRLIQQLLQAPDLILDAQTTFDDADRAYKARLANLSLEAMSLPLFVGKDGAKRTASNDTERTLAVEQAVANDALLIRQAQIREAALRELLHARNTYDAAKMVAQLLTSGKS